MDSSNLEENEFVCCEFEIAACKPSLQDLKKESHVHCGRIFVSEKETFIFICTFCEELFLNIEHFKSHMKHYHRSNMKLSFGVLNFDKNSMEHTETENDNNVIIHDNQDDYIYQENEISNMSYDNTCKINEQNVNEIPEISLDRTHGEKNKNIPEDDAVNSNQNNVKAIYDNEQTNKINTIEKKSRNLHGDWLNSNDEKLFQTMQSNGDRINENICESISDNSDQNNSSEEIYFNEQNTILNNNIEEISESIFKSINMDKFLSNEDDDGSLKIASKTSFLSENDDQSKTQKKEGNISKKFDCEFCGRNLYTKQRLQSHKLIKHSDTDVIILIGRNFTCEVCNKSFPIKEQLESHIASYCLKIKNEKINYDEKIQEIIKSNPLECRFCHQRFKIQSQCDSHELIHTGKKPFSCKFCNKTFRLKKTLQNHVMVHKGIKPYKCNICDSWFTALQNLKVHMRRHLGQKNYKCDYCGKKFVTSTERNSHSRYHTGEKPYKCSICNKQLYNCAVYLEHLHVEHYGNKFKCKQCDKAFNTNNSLKLHSLTHSNVKLFECNICQRKFQIEKYLKLHMNSHLNIKNYLCSECGETFRLNVSLSRHMKIH